jgi:AraC-like DNA-binding protein
MNASPPLMSYDELPPSDPLALYVASYWSFRVMPAAGEIPHTVPLTGGFILSVRLAGGQGLLVGPRVTPLHVTVYQGDVFMGVHFWPGAASSLIGVPAASMRERVLPLSEICGKEWTERLVASLCCAGDDAAVSSAFDAALCERIAQAAPLDELVMTAVLAIVKDQRVRIPTLAERAGLSPRQLRRRFLGATGMTMKELLRIRRLRASAAAAALAHEPVQWGGVAAERGFADQAHMSGEFRRLTGLTPVSFQRHARRIAHGKIRD